MSDEREAPDSGWVESTEGDLDPDLTEEAGYSAWEPPPHRSLAPLLLRVGAALALGAMLASVLGYVIR